MRSLALMIQHSIRQQCFTSQEAFHAATINSIASFKLHEHGLLGTTKWDDLVESYWSILTTLYGRRSGGYM